MARDDEVFIMSPAEVSMDRAQITGWKNILLQHRDQTIHMGETRWTQITCRGKNSSTRPSRLHSHISSANYCSFRRSCSGGIFCFWECNVLLLLSSIIKWHGLVSLCLRVLNWWIVTPSAEKILTRERSKWLLYIFFIYFYYYLAFLSFFFKFNLK